jgi:hypothetical protein
VASEPLFRGVRRVPAESLAKNRSAVSEESCDHAVLVVKQRAASC